MKKVETVFGRDIGDYIRTQRTKAQISLRELAKLAGVSNPYLSQIERGLRRPSAEILQQIAKGLRISAEALYVQAGILEQRQGGAVVDAVLADPELTERQKQVLLDIYESFRRENEARAAQAAGTPDDEDAPETEDLPAGTPGTIKE
jgi:transcriptional regulator with XRE-family HTH domain